MADSHIHIDSWEKMVGRLGGDLVYMSTDAVPSFFRSVRGTGRSVVLVSGCSDYTVCEQNSHFPNEDLGSLAASVDWEKAGKARDAYHCVRIGPACEPEHCRVTDRYSLKTERFTWATFDSVPNEVRNWFTTNLNIEHDRAELLPFGLNSDGPGKNLLRNHVGKTKTRGLYVNFQNNSVERVRLKQYYSEPRQSVTFRPTPDMPVDDYLREMSEHRFVLCPDGNGIDCYRVWEAIYLGCIALMRPSVLSRRLASWGLPVVVLSSLFGLDHNKLVELDSLLPQTWDLTRADLSYWEERLRAA